MIYVMQRDQEEVIAARLAESLGVSAPTVTVTLKRMRRDGWISVSGRSRILLTEAGRGAAQSVIRRHMLTEWMLARMLHVPWSRIHEEAHQIEHTISDETEAQMRLNLDDPQTCPHGNPLPGYERVAADWQPLTELTSGEVGVIRRIHERAEDNPEFIKFLEAAEIFPGVQVEVEEVLDFNQTMTLRRGERRVTLGLLAARHLYVEKF
jgi:DtxR family Mn-dependent transcriptional regulator